MQPGEGEDVPCQDKFSAPCSVLSGFDIPRVTRCAAKLRLLARDTWIGCQRLRQE